MDVDVTLTQLRPLRRTSKCHLNSSEAWTHLHHTIDDQVYCSEHMIHDVVLKVWDVVAIPEDPAFHTQIFPAISQPHLGWELTLDQLVLEPLPCLAIILWEAKYAARRAGIIYVLSFPVTARSLLWPKLSGWKNSCSLKIKA